MMMMIIIFTYVHRQTKLTFVYLGMKTRKKEEQLLMMDGLGREMKILSVSEWEIEEMWNVISRRSLWFHIIYLFI